MAQALTSARHVVLTTHVNADGDGVGSEVGLWHLLRGRGVSVTIANPTGIPERFRTPWKSTILTGVFVATLAALVPLRILADLVNIGTLLAFVIVSIGILVLRKREPNLPRVFKTPAVWAVAPLGALSALYLMVSLSGRTWARLGIWFVIGMFVYVFYGIGHSRLAAGPVGPPPGSSPPVSPPRR